MGAASEIPDGTFVLVVDDEPRVRDVVARMVASADYGVYGVESGQKALEMAFEWTTRISCIVLDVHMPGMSGFEVLEALRSRGLSTPVVLSSGDAVPDDSSADAHTYFLRKPYLRNELIRVLGRAHGS
jgi:CheY-like chemotaxis protein